MSAAARLIVIPQSNYCEKARWSLELAAIEFSEAGHAPVFHLPHVARRRAQTTPVLEYAGRETIRGSDAILEHAAATGASELLPGDDDERAEVERLMTVFDERLGPATRRWFYSWALEYPALLTAMAQVGVPAWERRLVPSARPLIARLLAARFDVRAGTRDEAEQQVSEVFAEADGARGPGSPYLVGDHFSAADLTFAALGAPITWPAGYGPAGALVAGDLPPAMAHAAAAWAATPSGEAIAAVYARHRRAAAQRQATARSARVA